MIVVSHGGFKICAEAQKVNHSYKIKGKIIAADKTFVDEHDILRDDPRLNHHYISSKEADMTFVAAAKIYLQSDINTNSFSTMHLALIDKKNSNIQYEIINYNGSIINIWPAVDEMLQVYLNDALEKEDDLTEIYNFLQEKIISQKEFDIMTENKIGIFPQKILLGTKDGYKICGLYNKATHILSTDKVKFRINLPEYLNNCIVSVDIMRIEI